MEIYIAADHRGYEMKNELVRWLKDSGYTVKDLGPATLDTDDDYPDYGIKVAEAVAESPKTRLGILLCGSGVGMSVVAGKVPGIRAALIHDPAIAQAAQRDDNLNVLALGSSYIDTKTAQDVILAWLTTPFSGEARHQRRIDKIKRYERGDAH